MAGSWTSTPPPGPPLTIKPTARRWGPIRLDYFGDTVESLHRIDPDTMGSAGRIESARIIGASTQQIQSDDHTVNLIDLLPDDARVHSA